MSTKPDNAANPIGSRRQRKRLRGMFTGKTGKAIGFTSIAAPIIGYVVRDLGRPDSVIRGLIGNVARTLLGGKAKKAEAIDITDKVEVIEDHSERRQ
jgi:hypothetical protein